MKHKSLLNKVVLEPPRIFLGDSACGKFFSMKLMYLASAETLPYQTTSIVSSQFVAPTSVVATNFESATIHSTLKIPIGCFQKSLHF